MTRWEYKTIVLTGAASDEERLDQAGAEGWELVAVTSAAGWVDREGFPNDWSPVAYFKRAVEDRRLWDATPAQRARVRGCAGPVIETSRTSTALPSCDDAEF